MNLKKYFEKEKKLNIFIIIIILINGFGTALKQVTIAKLADSLIDYAIHNFINWLVINIILAITMLLLGNLIDYLEEFAIQKMNLPLRNDLATGVANQTMDQFNKDKSVGKYTSWFTNDVVQIDQKGFQIIFSFTFYLAGIVFPVGAFMLYHWSLAITAIILGVVLTFLPKIIQAKLEKSSYALTISNEHFVNQIENLLNGFETLVSFASRNQIVQRIRQESQNLQSANMVYKKSEISVQLISDILSVFSQFIIIGLTGFLILKHILTPGVLLGAGSLAGIIFTSMSQLASLLVKTKAVKPIFEKYDNLNLKPVKSCDILQQKRNLALTLDHVRKVDGHQLQLAPTSGTFGGTDKIAITGASGAGKSTLLRIVAGLTNDFQGKVIWSMAENNQQPYIIYVPQKPYIFNDSVLFNLTLGRNFSENQIQQALNKVALSKTISELPQGLQTVLTTNGADLSGGQRQRLALARVILLKPAVLLLDESTSSIDAETAELIEKIF